MAIITPPDITTAPAVPSRGDRATFSTRLDAFIAWLVTAVSQFSALASNVYNNALDCYSNATAAASFASQAAISNFSALYTFDSGTSMAAPGTGKFRLNNATIASATAMAFQATTADTGNPNLGAFIATWGASTSAIKGHITLRKIGAPETFATFSIGAAITDNTTWLQAAVAYVTGSGTLSNNDSVSVQFSRTGDAGATNTAADIHGATSKTTPVDADELGLIDSAASNVLKKLTWVSLKAALKTYFDTLYGYPNIPINSQSANYTTVLSDAGKCILHPSADTTARTHTIDSNANVPYAIGTAITFSNQNGAGVVTIAITSDTMRLAGAGTTGSRTLAANGLATAMKEEATVWKISGTGLT